MSRLQPRLALLEEADAIARLVEAAYGLYVPRIGKKPAPMLADYAALVASGEVTLLPGPEGPEAILVMRPREDALFVENLAVAPDRQGRGLGRLLMDHAEAVARSLGLGAVRLYTNAAMTENLAFYPRLGFAVERRIVEDGFDRVYFVKTMGGEREGP